MPRRARRDSKRSYDMRKFRRFEAKEICRMDLKEVPDRVHLVLRDRNGSVRAKLVR